MLCGLLLFIFLYLEILDCSFIWIFEQSAYAAAVSIPVSIPGQFYSVKFAPWFQTAGFGVFAGRAFKQNGKVPASWKILFLPKNFPRSEFVNNYIFGYNETHTLLILDYGSLLNHHESANVKPVAVPGSNSGYFRVRMGFVCANCNVLKNMQYACLTDTRTHKHFQGHKRYRGWTGNFGSIWRCGVVWN